MSNIEDTLKERGSTYGHFPNVAYTSQTLRNCMTEFDGWDNLNDTQREALTVIAQKIARILNGNPDYIDNWHDIAGYATLVEKSLSSEAATVVETNTGLNSLSDIKVGQYYTTNSILNELAQVVSVDRDGSQYHVNFNVLDNTTGVIKEYYSTRWESVAYFNNRYKTLKVDSLDQVLSVMKIIHDNTVTQTGKTYAI